jgi:hypothetical protein
MCRTRSRIWSKPRSNGSRTCEGGEEKRRGISFEKGAPILQEAADIAREAMALITRFSKLTETISADIKYHPPVKRLKELVEMEKN